MKKYLIISCLLFLVGCSNDLDTSQLRETQVSEDESMKFYDAPSVEVAIDALPYEVNLPVEFPFKTEGFKFLGITDYGGEGKNPEAMFIAMGENEHTLYLTTTLGNMDYPESQPEKITLDNGYMGFFQAPNHLDVVVKDVTYLYTLTMPGVEEEQVKAELLKLAEQLSD